MNDGNTILAAWAMRDRKREEGIPPDVSSVVDLLAPEHLSASVASNTHFEDKYDCK